MNAASFQHHGQQHLKALCSPRLFSRLSAVQRNARRKWKPPECTFTSNYQTVVMTLSRKSCSCQVAWRASTSDGSPIGGGGARCVGKFCFLRLASRVIAAFYIMNKYLWGLHMPCRCVIRSLLRTAYVRPNGCVLKKSHELYYSSAWGETLFLSHLSTPPPLLPPCVLIVSANSGVFRQVRCKCGWCDLHLQKNMDAKEEIVYYTNAVLL